MIFYILLTIPFIALGALLSRAHGGGELPGKVGAFIDKLSLEAFLLALPLVPILFLAGVHWLLIIVAYASAVIAVRKGHGQYMTLPYSEKIITPEDIDYLPTLFFGPDPRISRTGNNIVDTELLGLRINDYGKKKLYWRNVFGMSISGLCVTLLSSIFLLIDAFLVASIVLFIAGLLKSLAYIIGWKVFTDDNATELAEYARGAILFFGYTVAGALVLLG